MRNGENFGKNGKNAAEGLVITDIIHNIYNLDNA